MAHVTQFYGRSASSSVGTHNLGPAQIGTLEAVKIGRAGMLGILDSAEMLNVCELDGDFLLCRIGHQTANVLASLLDLAPPNRVPRRFRGKVGANQENGWVDPL